MLGQLLAAAALVVDEVLEVEDEHWRQLLEHDAPRRLDLQTPPTPRINTSRMTTHTRRIHY